MSNYYTDTLLAQVQTYVSEGQPVPLDLWARLLAEGFDISALTEEPQDPYLNEDDNV
jgi:hypothetical protein